MATRPRITEAANNPDKGQLRGGFMNRVYLMLERAGWARQMGVQFGGKRDLYEAFGWDLQLNVQQMYDMYTRGGIAKRLVEAKPDSTWGRPPRIYLPDQVEWSQEFARLAWDSDLWSVLRRADILAGLGRFAIVLIGTNRGRIDLPIPKGGAGTLQITYLQPYGETQVKIKDWERDPMNPRFGQPTMYTISPVSTTRNAGEDRMGLVDTDTRPQGSAFDVHHSRVLHISRGILTSNVFGIPEYAPVWNYLTDLMKVVGASSESYWKQSYPGLHINVDKDMDLDEEDELNLTAEVDEYEHGFRRAMRTRGVEIENLMAKVADPRGAFDVLLTLISGTSGIPKRILLGSEAGQLASSQDKASWAERIEEYRELHAEPRIIWPFVMWAINNGITPLPADTDIKSARCLWPDAYRMSPLERGQTAAQTARSLANIQKGMQPIIIEEGVDAIPATPESSLPDGTVVPGSEGQEGKEAVTEEALITRDEARRIIGLSTDQKLLAEFPEDGS